MVNLAQLNPFGAIGIKSIGFVLLVLFLAVIILGLIGFAIWFYIQRKQLKYTIPLQKKIGNNVMTIATYKAKDYKIGMSGDKLWYVPKAKKYISPATLQTAPNEYTHFEREDGEWINVNYPDIDEEMKKMGVKYVHQDMRANRIAIGDILEQRFKDKKSFWEKYGHLITHVIFYMIVCLALVIIFYQWSDIITRTSTLLDQVIAYDQKKCPTTSSIVPAMIGVIFWRFKSKW